MSLTSRKKRPLNRNVSHLRDTKLFIIATEGEKTEKQYFEIFQNPKVQVRIIPTEAGLSAPEYVYDRLEQFHEQYQLGDDDELWLMIDVDRWGDEKLSQIAANTTKKGFRLAISNPCFEVWLYLHFSDCEEDELSCNDFKFKLRQQNGSYNPSNLDLEVYRPFVADAVSRARVLREYPNERWPASIGSHVYKVVEVLL